MTRVIAAFLLLIGLPTAACAAEQTGRIDRQALVKRHNPSVVVLDPLSPFSVGNGRFLFTADITGFQSFPERYYRDGIPLETKARWAWGARLNPNKYQLQDAMQEYNAYGRKVKFPTDMESDAGQWLRQNPHDLPLARIALAFDGKSLEEKQVTEIRQTLDMWSGVLTSQYRIEDVPVTVTTVSHPDEDGVAFRVQSGGLLAKHLGVDFCFPRGYDPAIKNTPKIDWSDDDAHITELVSSEKNTAVFHRRVDGAEHWVRVHWFGAAKLHTIGKHHFRLEMLELTKAHASFDLRVIFLQSKPSDEKPPVFAEVMSLSQTAWRRYWNGGAAVDFSDSRDPRAFELERRVVLSQYLLAVQSRSDIPPQETGLISSSWYGKFHTEMMWWHNAHWISWGRGENAERVLNWYLQHMEDARELARERGLRGVRWAKMVGPEGRESPGGNPLIIWNQPQPIHLAEMLYQAKLERDILLKYETLVKETAEGVSSMLVWDKKQERFSLEPPIWIAQEIYDPVLTRNPAFELSYLRFALQTALLWQHRLGKKRNMQWIEQIKKLAPLPVKDGRYVAIESIPDTFDNIESRRDHPTMLASWGLLHDERVNASIMRYTLRSVLTSWDWEEKIWGWDYPMIAMTALKLDDPRTALEILLKDAPHNRYLKNGHCPQPGAGLPVYLPANGALLSAVARMVSVRDKNGNYSGFPKGWQVKSEGF